MKVWRILVVCWATAVCVPVAAQTRVWTDSTGEYTVEAELIAFDDGSVVLQRADHELGTVAIEKLSEEDREYLKSNEASEAAKKKLDGVQDWILKDGSKIIGRLVDFTRRDITLQRRRSRNFVNDRRLETLPEFYQQMVPEIIAHFDSLPSADRRGLDAWMMQQRGRPRSFQLEGVVLELENGDEFAVPFFLLSDEDLKVLTPSWDEWLAANEAHDYDTQEDLGFLLRSLAAAREHDSLVQREIAMMQLNLQAVKAGLTSLWEVTLHPAAGQGGPPLWVVVPGRDSRQATITALDQNPGFVSGPVRRVSSSPRSRR